MSSEAPEDTDRNAGTRISRRQSLRAISATGFSLSGLGSTATVVGREGGTVEVVTHLEGDCVARTREVSRRWHKHTMRTRKANEALTQRLAGRDDVWGVATGRGKEQIGGLETHRLSVALTPDGNAREIPDTVDGIPVQTKRGEPPRPAYCYHTKYPELKGGIWMSVPKHAHQGTLFGRVKDYRNGQWRTYVLGARHVFMSDGEYCSSGDPTGMDWKQETLAGTVVDHFPQLDTVLLDNSKTSRSIDDTIVDESGCIAGRVTEAGLECLKGNLDHMYRRGIVTCASSAPIAEIKGTIICSLFSIGGIVETESTMKEGDSGGPVYDEVFVDGGTDKLYAVNMASIIGSFNTSNDYTMGSSAEKMNKNENLWFGGDPWDGPC